MFGVAQDLFTAETPRTLRQRGEATRRQNYWANSLRNLPVLGVSAVKRGQDHSLWPLT